jgi:hypothetical protein
MSEEMMIEQREHKIEHTPVLFHHHDRS